MDKCRNILQSFSEIHPEIITDLCDKVEYHISELTELYPIIREMSLNDDRCYLCSDMIRILSDSVDMLSAFSTWLESPVEMFSSVDNIAENENKPDMSTLNDLSWSFPTTYLNITDMLHSHVNRMQFSRCIKCTSLEPSGSDLPIGIEFLDKGAFGNVHFYNSFFHNKKFAWKRMIKSSHHITRSFEQEIRILNYLGLHPSIVTFFCSLMGGSYLMEHMPGGSLRKHLDDNGCQPMKEPEIKNIAKQILDGLTFIHDKQIIHRDVRAANILLDGKGHAKLADFGLAKKIHDYAAGAGIMNEPYGNCRWNAPEMLFGEEYNTKVDIWSFGATMVEMVTGHIPFHKWTDLACWNFLKKWKRIEFKYPKGSSDHIKSYISSCLLPSVSVRPTAAELLSHDFLAGSYITSNIAGLHSI